MTANKQLKTALDRASNAKERLNQVQTRANHNPSSEKLAQDLSKAKKSKNTAEDAYAKALSQSIGVIRTGSGRVALALPSHVVNNLQK